MWLMTADDCHNSLRHTLAMFSKHVRPRKWNWPYDDDEHKVKAFLQLQLGLHDIVKNHCIILTDIMDSSVIFFTY